MTNQEMKPKKTQREILNSLKSFREAHQSIVNKYGYLTSKEAVFEAIELVMASLYEDYNIMNADVDDDEEACALFLFVGGVLISLVDYVYVDDMPVMYLSFHVACAPNTAIRINNAVSKMVDIPVISSHVFYPYEEPGDESSIILYNSKAVRAYTRDLSESIYETRKRHEDAMNNIRRSDKLTFH